MLTIKIVTIMVLEVVQCETECSDYSMFVLKSTLNV